MMVGLGAPVSGMYPQGLRRRAERASEQLRGGGALAGVRVGQVLQQQHARHQAGHVAGSGRARARDRL